MGGWFPVVPGGQSNHLHLLLGHCGSLGLRAVGCLRVLSALYAAISTQSSLEEVLEGNEGGLTPLSSLFPLFIRLTGCCHRPADPNPQH